MSLVWYRGMADVGGELVVARRRWRFAGRSFRLGGSGLRIHHASRCQNVVGVFDL